MDEPRLASSAGGPSGLVYVVWELTLRCDMSCEHCGSRGGRARADELATDEALDVVRQLAAMGAREVTLIGGEAYLREDWDVVARAIVDAGMRCTMTTGGRGFDAARARRARDAGLAAVSVSIDGLRGAHDTLRGLVGSWDAALAALDAGAAAGLEMSANTQISRLSAPDLEPLLDVLAERGVRGWQMQLTVPMGRAAERPEWLLQPYELLGLYPALAALVRRAAARGVSFWPANNIGYFGPHEALLRGRGARDDRAWTGCVAGKHALGLESDGTVKGCPSLPTETYSGGNVRARTLQRIWDESAPVRFTRDRDASSLWGFCRTCYYADTCRAGCTWTSHVFFGRPGNNPYCHHRALALAREGLAERFVQVTAPPGLPFDHGRFALEVVPLAEAEATRPRRRLPLAR